MNALKSWFGIASCIVLNILVAAENYGTIEGNANRRNLALFKKLATLSTVAVLVGFIAFYPHSSTHFAFLGIFVGTTSYAFALHNHARSGRTKEDYILSLICTVLVLLMNDWTVVYKSIRDGTIFYRLFWNTMHYLLFLSYAIWNNILACILDAHTKTFEWKFIIAWQKEVVETLAFFYGGVVFATLYAPSWQGNH